MMNSSSSGERSQHLNVPTMRIPTNILNFILWKNTWVLCALGSQSPTYRLYIVNGRSTYFTRIIERHLHHLFFLKGFLTQPKALLYQGFLSLISFITNLLIFVTSFLSVMITGLLIVQYFSRA